MTAAPFVRGHAAARGFTVIEVLVSLALVALVLALVGATTAPALDAFEADPAAADASQRARGTVQALFDDIERAGSGFVGAAEMAPGTALPALWPDGANPGAFIPGARAHLLSAWHAPRSAAHASLRADVPAGAVQLPLARPGFCAPAWPSCGIQADDAVLIYGPHGRLAMAIVRQVLPGPDLEIVAPLAEAWPAGTFVSVIETHTYELRPDASTGLSQITRRLGPGPATALADYVTRFDVEWLVDDTAPRLIVAPPDVEEDATTGPRPPAPGVVGAPPWPAGENCAFSRDAAGVARWRGGGGAAGVQLAPLTAFADGPWCPSAGAVSRWDLDLTRVVAVRVVLAMAAAVDALRPSATLGLRRPRARLVPDLVLDVTLRPGRRNGGR